MTRSITFENLTHDELVRLSAAYDEIKNLKIDTRAEDYADRTEQSLPQPTDDEIRNMSAPSPIADYQPKPALDAAIEIDAVGVPYNAEFHSTSKQKTAAGEWRMRKGADKARVKAWRDQHIRGGAQQPAQQSVPATNDPGTPPTAPQQYFAPPSMPQQPAIPVPTEPVEAPDYGTWYQLFNELWTNGRLTTDLLAQMNQQARAIDASAYANDEQARGMSYQFMQKLAA